MKLKDAERAGHLALAMADELASRLPGAFALSIGELTAVTLPLAQSLIIAERKARKNRKHAKVYRRVVAEVRRLMSADGQAPAASASGGTAAGAVPRW